MKIIIWLKNININKKKDNNNNERRSASKINFKTQFEKPKKYVY